MKTELILGILELAVKYGVPAVREAIAAVNKEIITQADIDALPALIKRPEEYA